MTPTAPPPEPDFSPRSYLWIGFAVLALLFLGLGGWAALASIDGAVIGPGVVVVESNQKLVQHLEGGIVGEIHVREGQRVEAGELLLRLDDTVDRASLSMIEGQRDERSALAARLNAELAGADDIAFPATLLARAVAPEIAEILAGQRALFQARRETRQTRAKVLGQRIAQLREQIQGLAAQKKSKERQIDLVDEELIGLRALFRKGHAPKTRILALEREGERLRGELGAHLADQAVARKAIGETELEIANLESAFREEALAELRDTKGRLHELDERRVGALDKLRRMAVHAPQAGTVLDLTVHTIGGVIEAGVPLLRIVPGHDRLLIEAQIRPEDVDKVLPGTVAKVRFSAFNLRSTPELTGEVEKVSADRLQDPTSGLPFYQAYVRVSDAELGRLEGLTLLPGMPAEVYLATGRRSVLSHLMKPISDQVERALREE